MSWSGRLGDASRARRVEAPLEVVQRDDERAGDGAVGLALLVRRAGRRAARPRRWRAAASAGVHAVRARRRAVARRSSTVAIGAQR